MTSHHHETESPAQETPLDAWHQHTAEEGLPQTEHGAHANTHALLVVFAVIIVSTVVFSAIIGMFAINQMNRLKGEREVAGLASLANDAAAYKEDAQATQSAYGWTPEGNVRIPIDKAMEKVIARYQDSTQEAGN